MNSIEVQVPCRNVGVLAEIEFIIGVYLVDEQGKSENILASVIQCKI